MDDLLHGRGYYRSIVRYLCRMLQQLHALTLVVPQERGVMQKSLLGDGLRIAPKLDIPKTVICMHAMIAVIVEM